MKNTFFPQPKQLSAYNYCTTYFVVPSFTLTLRTLIQLEPRNLCHLSLTSVAIALILWQNKMQEKKNRFHPTIKETKENKNYTNNVPSWGFMAWNKFLPTLWIKTILKTKSLVRISLIILTLLVYIYIFCDQGWLNLPPSCGHWWHHLLLGIGCFWNIKFSLHQILLCRSYWITTVST